jgi:thiol-disulfide isomerase/thioredoxin
MIMKFRAMALAAVAVALTAALDGCGHSGTPSPVASSAALSPAQACAGRAATTAATASASDKPSDKPRPSLKVTTLDGKPFELSAQCGHWVVVNFWATWCGPCLQEIPDLSAFVKTRKDVSIIGLDFEEIEKPELQVFLKQHAPGYPIAVVDTFHPPQDFDVPRGLPTSYLIGPDGTVVKKFLGPITIKELQQMIDKAKTTPG